MPSIDVRPQILTTAHAFEKNDLRLTAIVDPEIDFTAEDVRAEVWSAVKKLYEIENVTIDGQNIYIDLTQPQVEKLPTAGRCFIVFKGDYKWGYNISVDLGFGTPFNTSATISLNLKGDPGKDGDLTAEAQSLKLLMDEDREATSADRLQTGEDRIEVSNDTESVGLYHSDVVLKYNEILEVQMEVDESKRIRVATYAAMVALLILNKARKYRVLADETQLNEETGTPEPYVLYTWDGEILYVFDIYPKNPQPTLN